jgi:dihydroflavonol-4-reductase
MKAFVTGATGFVGSHLVEKLLSMNHEVYCLKRKTSNTKWLKGKSVTYIEGDLFDNNALENVIKKVDYLFHVAGVVKSKNKEGFYKANSEATRNLIEIAYKANPNLKRFVHVSSLAACGPNPDEKPITEDFIPRPITTYGLTKRLAEKEILKFKDKLPITIVRPPAIYGPRDTEILIYFKTFSKGLNSIIGFDDKYLSLVYIEDLVQGLVLSMKENIRSGEIYFISSDGAYNWEQIATITSEIMSKKAIKIRIPHFVVYTTGFFAQMFSVFSKNAATLNLEKCLDITRKRWVCSNEKAKKELNYSPEYSISEGFKKTIEWYKENGWL